MEPDLRPLGWIAVGLSAMSLLLAASYVLSPLAYLPAALAIVFGLAARKDAPTRTTGTVALALGLLAVGLATGVVVAITRPGSGY